MTVSNRLTSKCVQGLALVFALLALPLAGNLSANEAGSPKLEVTKKKSQDKDLKEIWKKLQAAVKAGKMTQEEAKKKMAALKTKSHLEGIWKKLQAAVKAGKMTQEEAKKKMAALKKKYLAKKKGADLKEIWKKLQAAVKAGKMTQKEADAKMEALKKEAEAKSKAKTKKSKK